MALKEKHLRPMLMCVRERFGSKPLVGAEIGVQKGRHARIILNGLNMKRLVLVDIWDSRVTNPGRLHRYTEANPAKERYKKEMMERVGFEPNVEICEAYSVDACNKYSDGLFHFVYIDACHRYKAVLEDCRCWYPKIKKGGVIGGHDYNNPECPSVNRAVQEFANESGLKLCVGVWDWWLVKERCGPVDFTRRIKREPLVRA